MAVVRFLDGKHAGTAVDIADTTVLDEGSYWFRKKQVSTPGAGKRYYLKSVPLELREHPDVTEWTAARDNDPDED